MRKITFLLSLLIFSVTPYLEAFLIKEETMGGAIPCSQKITAYTSMPLGASLRELGWSEEQIARFSQILQELEGKIISNWNDSIIRLATNSISLGVNTYEQLMPLFEFFNSLEETKLVPIIKGVNYLFEGLRKGEGSKVPLSLGLFIKDVGYIENLLTLIQDNFSADIIEPLLKHIVPALFFRGISDIPEIISSMTQIINDVGESFKERAPVIEEMLKSGVDISDLKNWFEKSRFFASKPLPFVIKILREEFGIADFQEQWDRVLVRVLEYLGYTPAGLSVEPSGVKHKMQFHPDYFDDDEAAEEALYKITSIFLALKEAGITEIDEAVDAIGQIFNEIEGVYLGNTINRFNDLAFTIIEMLKSGVNIADLDMWFGKEPDFFKVSCLPSVIRSLRDKGIVTFAEQWRQVYSEIIDGVKSLRGIEYSGKFLDYLIQGLFQGEDLNKIMNDVREILHLGAVWATRFSPETWRELIANRRYLEEMLSRGETPHYPKPLAIVIYPVDDWNGALNRDHQVSELIAQGYFVLYFEVNNLFELLKAIGESTAPEAGTKASVLALYGHGSPDTIDGYLHVEESCLSALRKFGVGDCLEEGGVIGILACNTGGAGGIGDRLAEFFPQAGYIFAPLGEPSGIYFDFNEAGKIIWARYTGVGTYDAAAGRK